LLRQRQAGIVKKLVLCMRGRGWCLMKWSRLVLPLAVPALLVGGYILLQSGPPQPKPPPPSAPPASAFAPPAPTPPAEDVRKTIETRGDKLTRDLAELRRLGVPDSLLVDVEIYRKAALWIARHDEFYGKDAAAWTVDALDRGLLRASQQLRGESPWLSETGRSVVRGYRSRIDGSVQPYAVTFPADYGKDQHKKWRLDVVLHGRNSQLTEVSFLHDHRGTDPAPKEQQWVQIDIYGRGNNGYRWAGEVDVSEAMDTFLAVEQGLKRSELLDPNRFVLRGFSMGGAGTWHLGLHRPDHWCVLGAGAGFATTHGYADVPDKLPPYQEACLHIYDAVDYAENAANVPVVAYAGADDPQIAAARAIEARLKPAGIPMTFLVARGLKHQFPPEWQQKAEAEYAKYSAKGRPSYPAKVHFETWTLKYPSTDWVEVLALEHHYRRALVDAEQKDDGFTITTANVQVLHLTMPPGSSRQATPVAIDGQKVEAQPYLATPEAVALHLYLEKREGKWGSVLPERLSTQRFRGLHKVAGLQGPIDDAFMGRFLCVRGKGPAWHELTQAYAEAALESFREEWSKYFRGELPIKDDVEVTPQDIGSCHLILFGDPSSNSLIQQMLPDLPMKWSKERITWGGKEYSAAEHLPVFIYPSPLATDRYVVLNTGHTFHAGELQGTNALLFPRLGDWAILKLVPEKKGPPGSEVVRAGLFDEAWKHEND
jgi:dienelactone hydrolase